MKFIVEQVSNLSAGGLFEKTGRKPVLRIAYGREIEE